MNSEGKVQRLPGLPQENKRRTGLRRLVSVPQDGSETAGEKSSTEPPTPPKPPPRASTPTLQTTAEEEDDEIRKGDYKLYPYYFGSVTMTFILLLFVTSALAALSERIPGKISAS